MKNKQKNENNRVLRPKTISITFKTNKKKRNTEGENTIYTCFSTITGKKK